MHGHLKEVLLDFGPVQEFGLFSFERYNGLLGKQPTNNRSIETQLMCRFLSDTAVNNLSFPDQFADNFSSLTFTDRLVGSVLDTVTLQQFTLPTRSTRGVFDSDELEAIERLYQSLCSNCGSVTVNSVFTKYSSITLHGKQYGSSGKRATLHLRKAFIALSLWDCSLYGSQPTVLPNAGELHSNKRPVNIHYFVKATLTGTLSYPN